MFHAACASSTNRSTLNGGDCVETTVNFKKLINCEIVQNSANKVDIVDNNNYTSKNNEKDTRVVTTIKLENDSITNSNNHLNDKNILNEENEKVNKNIYLKSNTNNNKNTKVEKKNSFLTQITNGKNNVFENMKKFIVKRSATNGSTDLNRNLNNSNQVKEFNCSESVDTNTNVKQENTDVVDYW